MIKYLQALTGLVLAMVILLSPLEANAASTKTNRLSTYEQISNKDFSGQSLIYAEFTKVKFENANFSNADLRGAVFNGALISNANLHGVDFYQGIAYLVDFQGTDLSDGHFVEAMMLNSTFNNVNITGADFTNALIDGLELKKLCAKASGVNSKTGVATRDSLECK